MIDSTGHEAHLNLDPPDEETELDLVYNDLHRAQEKIKRLQILCLRAADALEVFKYDVDWILRKQALIAELRKAAE